MSGPIDIVLCLHNAFRRDALEIDEAAFKVAHSGGDAARILDRLRTTGEVLDYHARGEEEAVFPVIDSVAPLVAEAYILDHRELDTMVAGFEVMRAAPDALAVARATAVLNAHLRIHLNKEDAHLYRILRERTTEEEQKSIVGLMARKIPPDRTPTLVRWLFPLLGNDDRAVVTRGWMTLMPPQVFAGLKPIIRETLAGEWTELTRRIPELG
jgi:iron-sulfur cluster repair protein YtfE (RIC family)